MTTEQIQILINHGEIKKYDLWEVNTEPLEIHITRGRIVKDNRYEHKSFNTNLPPLIEQNQEFMNAKFLDTYTDEWYLISKRLFVLLKSIFDYFVDYRIEEELRHLRSTIREKEHRFAPGKNLKLKLYEKMISDYNDKIDVFYHYSMCESLRWNLFATWGVHFFEEPHYDKKNSICEVVLKTIKFEILNGRKIVDIKFSDLLEDNKIWEVHAFFYSTKKIRELYDWIAFEECIIKLKKIDL